MSRLQPSWRRTATRAREESTWRTVQTGGGRCLSRSRVPRAQVHGAGDAWTSQARSPVPPKLIPWLPRHGAGLGAEGFGLVARRNHKAMGIQRRLSARRNGIKTQLDGPAVLGHGEGGSRPRTVRIVGGQHLQVIDKHRGIGVDSLKAKHRTVRGHAVVAKVRSQMPGEGLHPLDIAFMRAQVWIRSEVSLHQGLEDMAWSACVNRTDGRGVGRRPLPFRLGQVDE